MRSVCLWYLIAGSRTLQFSYDLGNHLTAEEDPTSGLIAYGRSPVGEVTSITNETVQNSSNPANLVSNVVNGPFGPLTYSLGNGLSTVKEYDGLGRNNGGFVCSGSTSVSCTGGSQLYGYTANYIGNRVISGCDTILDQCQTNTYDAMNRLTSITDNSHIAGDAGSFSYSYDRWGNRLSQTATSGSGSSPNGTVNAATNQLTNVTYDAAGNQESDGISHTFTYDAEGNVTAVDNGNTATYVYDAMNHRIRSSAATNTYENTLEFMYDAQGRRTSTWLTSENFGIEGRIYWGGKQIAFRAITGDTYFEHQNYLGTERLRTSYLGAVAATEVSLPYGDDLHQTVPIPYADQDNGQYAGQEHDQESGSEHAQFRQYSSTQGRWMSPDPYDGSYNIGDPQSLNRYVYAQDNPLLYTDSNGQQIMHPCTGSSQCNNGDTNNQLNPSGGGSGLGGLANAQGIGYAVTGPNGTYDVSALPAFGDGDALDGSNFTAANGQYTGVNIQELFLMTPSGSQMPAFSSVPMGNFSVTVPGTVAPNNATPWYKNTCVMSALGKGAASTALDAVGTFVPAGGAAEGAVAGAFSLWRGAAGVSQGRNVFQGVMLAGGIVNTASAGSEGNSVSAGLGILGVAATLGKLAPGVGQIISGISMGIDIYQTAEAVGKCN